MMAAHLERTLKVRLLPADAQALQVLLAAMPQNEMRINVSACMAQAGIEPAMGFRALWCRGTGCAGTYVQILHRQALEDAARWVLGQAG